MKRLFAVSGLTLLLTMVAFGIGRVEVPSNVVLAWDPSPGPNIASYQVYYGAASMTFTNVVVVSGSTTNATVTNLVRGVTYFFAATAKDSAGLESDYSNEVSWTSPKKPHPPVIKSISGT